LPITSIELPHFAARRPAGLDPGFVEAHRLVLGPDQEQVASPLAALLGGRAIGEHPGVAFRSVAEALPELAKDASDRLLGSDGRSSRGGHARFQGELGVLHAGDPLGLD
jgi:hypothetical protein